MTRYRLTFDTNPKKLARRDAAGSHVALEPKPAPGGCRVEEDATGELVELDVRERENLLELYQRAFGYLPTGGHPGKRSGLAA